MRILLIFLIFSCACNSQNEKVGNQTFYLTRTGKLENTFNSIELEYVGFFCQCAQWITPDEYGSFKDTGHLSEHTIFIEPINKSLNLPDTIGYPGDVIRVAGRFYENKGYPKYFPVTEMNVDAARVFRYEKYEILKSNHKKICFRILEEQIVPNFIKQLI